MARATGRARVWVRLSAAVGVAVTAGLATLMVVTDLGTAATVAGILGALAGVAGAVFAGLALLPAEPSAPEEPPTAPRASRTVRAGAGGIAAGGDITGNAIGARAEVTGPGTPAKARVGADTGTDTGTDRGSRDVTAGRDGIAAGGDITGNAIGEGATHQ